MSICITPIFTMPNTKELAKTCAKRTDKPFIEWYDAITTAKTLALEAKINPNDFLEICNKSSNPIQVLLILEALVEYKKENPYSKQGYDLLLQYIKNSPFTFEDWLDTIEYFYSWLNLNKRRTSLKSMLSFIHSCYEHNSNVHSFAKLKIIVEKMLETYSYQD